jgi:hypothetical protein
MAVKYLGGLGRIGPLAVVRCGGGIRSLKIRVRTRSATKETSGFRGRRVRPKYAANSLLRNALAYIPFVFNILDKSSQVIAKYGSWVAG